MRQLWTPLWTRRPVWTRSVRFRLAVLSSSLLLLVATVVVGGLYLALARQVKREPVTRTFEAIEGVRTSDGGFRPLRRIQVAAVADIEAAVNAGTLTSLREYTAFALLGMFVTSLALGWFLASRALRPLRAMTATADEVRAGDLSRRVAWRGDDEIGALAESIDAMLAHLDEVVTSQRRFVDDASHELRTPLAVIRANVDAVLARPDVPPHERQRAVAVVGRAVDRMTALVEDMLAAARSVTAVQLQPAVPLAVLAHEEVDEFSSLAAERQVDLDVDLDHTTSAPVDPAMVRRAVDNLLANAVRLAPPGSTVRTSVGTSPDGQWAFVAVRDDGPGIPVPHQRRVFDRFWRVDPPGAEPDGHTGLGLSIVRQVAEAHGGRVRLHSSVGLGSVFVIWLPVTRGRGGGPPERSSSGPPELSPVELVGQFMDGSSG